MSERRALAELRKAAMDARTPVTCGGHRTTGSLLRCEQCNQRAQASVDLRRLATPERVTALLDALDALNPECLHCGERRETVRAKGLFCAIVGGGEQPEVEAEWERHRWRPWTDRELDAAGISPDAYERHRRTGVLTLPWVDCEDTKRGHETAATGGECVQCGKTPKREDR